MSEQNPNPAISYGFTLGDLTNLVNQLSNTNNQNTGSFAPNMISGYGNPVQDVLPLFNQNDLGVAYNNLVGSQAEQDALNRAFNVMQSANDFNRYQKAQQMGSDMRQDNLYGETLRQMLEAQAPQSIPMDHRIKERPTSRERHVTGKAAPGGDGYWTFTGLDPANQDLW